MLLRQPRRCPLSHKAYTRTNNKQVQFASACAHSFACRQRVSHLGLLQFSLPLKLQLLTSWRKHRCQSRIETERSLAQALGLLDRSIAECCQLLQQLSSETWFLCAASQKENQQLFANCNQQLMIAASLLNVANLGDRGSSEEDEQDKQIDSEALRAC